MFEFAKSLFGKWKFWFGLLLAFAAFVLQQLFKLEIPQWAYFALLTLALIVASYDVYNEQQKKIRNLEAEIALLKGLKAPISAQLYSDFDRAADAYTKVYGQGLYMDGQTYGNIQVVIFPDADLRGRCERYLGSVEQRGGGLAFRPLAPSNDLLLNPLVQKTIQDTLHFLDEFKANHPKEASQLKL